MPRPSRIGRAAICLLKASATCCRRRSVCSLCRSRASHPHAPVLRQKSFLRGVSRCLQSRKNDLGQSPSSRNDFSGNLPVRRRVLASAVTQLTVLVFGGAHWGFVSQIGAHWGFVVALAVADMQRRVRLQGDQPRVLSRCLASVRGPSRQRCPTRTCRPHPGSSSPRSSRQPARLRLRLPHPCPTGRRPRVNLPPPT